MIQGYDKDLYQEGIQSVVKSVILYSTAFRRIAVDLADLYSHDTIQPYDYATLFKNFYERTNQLIEAVSSTMAELIRRGTMVDSVRSKTTNSIRKEIIDDSFYELNENLQSFRAYIMELGIIVDTKTKENEFLTSTLTAGAVTALLSGTRKVSFVDGIAIAAIVNQTSVNNQQVYQMQVNKVNVALAAMVTTTSLLQNLVTRLMDQYCSLVYGGQIDLDTRDKYLSQSNNEINLIAEICNRIAFDAKNIYDLALRFRNYKKPMTEGEAYEHKKSERKIGLPLLALGFIMATLGFFKNEFLVSLIGGISIVIGFVKFMNSIYSSSQEQMQETPIQFANKMADQMRGYATQLEQITDRHLGLNS